MSFIEVAAVWCGTVALVSLYTTGYVWVFRDRFVISESDPAQLRLWFGLSLSAILVAFGAFLVVHPLGISEAFPEPMDFFDPGFETDATNMFEILLFAWLTASAAGVSLIPAASAYRYWLSDDFSRQTFLADLGRSSLNIGVMFALLGVPLLVSALDMAVLVPLLPIPLGFALLRLVTITRKRQIPELLETGEPTDEERRLIESALAETGFDSEQVTFLSDASEAGVHRPWTIGIGPYKRLYVPRQSFDDYSPEALRAILVQITWSQYGWTPRFIGVWGSYLSFLLAGIIMDKDGVGAALFLGIALVAFTWPFVWYRYGVKRVYATDSAVAKAVGPAVLCEALQRQLELMSDGGNRFVQYAVLLPSTPDRIERLQQEYGLDASETGSK